MRERREAPTGPVFKEVIFASDTKSFDPDQSLRFVASTEGVDRYGDVVRAEGWDLKAYNSNPIILFSHNASLPVGTSKVWLEGKQLMSDIQLAEAGTAPVVDYVRGLVRQRILRAVSVGFLPTTEPKYIRDAEKNITGFEFTNQELLEISLVAVPANSQALAVARSLKLSDDEVRRFFAPASRGMSVARARLELDKLRDRSRSS